MIIVPLQAAPNQTVQISLNGQSTTIHLYQRFTGMFCDLYLPLPTGLVIGGVICENLNRIVRDLYLGFLGDLMFLDNQGSQDPYYTGLGSRWQLMYLFPSDLPAGAG